MLVPTYTELEQENNRMKEALTGIYESTRWYFRCSSKVTPAEMHKMIGETWAQLGVVESLFRPELEDD